MQCCCKWKDQPLCLQPLSNRQVPLFRINQHNKINSFALCGTLFLLVVYLMGTVELNAFHSFLHSSEDQAKIHSAANELNGCHQSIYHNKKEKSCEHKTHVVGNKKCALCQLSFQSFHFFTARSIGYFSLFSRPAAGEIAIVITKNDYTHLSPRAPPLVNQFF